MDGPRVPKEQRSCGPAESKAGVGVKEGKLLLLELVVVLALRLRLLTQRACRLEEPRMLVVAPILH